MDKNVWPTSKESDIGVFTIRFSQLTGSVELNFRGVSLQDTTRKKSDIKAIVYFIGGSLTGIKNSL